MKLPLFRLILATLAFALISGCSMSPYIKDSVDNPEVKEAELTEDEYVRIGYLARYLAETEVRNELTAKIRQTEYVREWDYIDHSTHASMATDLVVGELGSDLGAGIGAAIFVAGMLSGDGSMDEISQIFLPSELDGKPLETPEQARVAGVNLIVDRLGQVAEKLGSELSCEFGCGEPYAIYSIRLPETPVSGESYVYWPKDIVITVDLLEFVPVAKDDPVSALVGFPVAWKTEPGDTAFLRMVTEPDYLEDGNIELYDVGDSGRKAVSAWRRLYGTKLGLSIRRALHHDTKWLWGIERGHPSLVYFEGEGYGYSLNSRVDFIDRVVTSPEAL